MAVLLHCLLGDLNSTHVLFKEEVDASKKDLINFDEAIFALNDLSLHFEPTHLSGVPILVEEFECRSKEVMQSIEVDVGGVFLLYPELLHC